MAQTREGRIHEGDESEIGKTGVFQRTALHPKGGINFSTPPDAAGPVEDFLSNNSIMVAYRTSILNLGYLDLYHSS